MAAGRRAARWSKSSAAANAASKQHRSPSSVSRRRCLLHRVILNLSTATTLSGRKQVARAVPLSRRENGIRAWGAAGLHISPDLGLTSDETSDAPRDRGKTPNDLQFATREGGGRRRPAPSGAYPFRAPDRPDRPDRIKHKSQVRQPKLRLAVQGLKIRKREDGVAAISLSLDVSSIVPYGIERRTSGVSPSVVYHLHYRSMDMT